MNGNLGRYEKTNIFDINTAQTLNGYITNDGYFSFYQTNAVVCIPITNGATYDISGVVRVNASTAIKYATFSSIPIVDTMSIRYGSFAQSETLTITAGTNENYIAVMFCGDGDYSAYGSVQNALNINCANMKVDTLQWQDIPYRRYETATETIQSGDTIYANGQPISTYSIKGNTVQSGTPTPSNPVEVQGVGNKTANLLDISLFATTYTGYCTYADDTLTITGVTTTMSNNGISVDIPANTVFTVEPLQVENGIVNARFKFEGDDGSQMIYLYDANGEPNTISPISFNFAINKITFLWSNASGKTAAFKFFMINSGSTALPYEPYGKYKISILKGLTALTPIYLSQPLRKSLDGTAFDTLDSTGLVTYNVDEYGQPQTATTETVTVPTITTTGGTVTLDVDTTIKPSEMSLTYHGWHEHQPLKRENGSWS